MEFLLKTIKSISNYIDMSMNESTEVIRLARSIDALYLSGINRGKPTEKMANFLVQTQSIDGGWTDPEETAWAAGCLNQTKIGNELPISGAVQWLKSNSLNGGGWGKHSRDRARIPTTALVLTLVPEAGSVEDYLWVAQEWAKDLSGSVQLSYKAGFYLLVAGHPSIQGDSILIDRTIKHLIDDQNEDGGFAPWKNHPIGSDPWSTGVVLWGLSKWIDRIDPAVIDKALHWLEVTQLPCGYWPYHYLDEGTSYALIGAVSAMRAMASRK
jgi:hypothetical protein